MEQTSFFLVDGSPFSMSLFNSLASLDSRLFWQSRLVGSVVAWAAQGLSWGSSLVCAEQRLSWSPVPNLPFEVQASSSKQKCLHPPLQRGEQGQ